jgi:phosphoserine phosphatase
VIPPAFASVVLDVDSTLSGLEGIDWLAARRSPELAAQVGRFTTQAMQGDLAVEDVYAARMDAVRPDADDLAALAAAYQLHMAPGAASTVQAMRDAGVRVVIVSGGLRPAIVPFARALGVGEVDVYAVDVILEDDGTYRDFERSSPLATARGKPAVVRALGLPAPTLAVGDGVTDLMIALEGAAETFAVFTGFVGRAAVVAHAGMVIRDFHELRMIVLPAP